MEKISAVSETAIITLRSRVIESRQEKPVLQDPQSEHLLEEMQQQLPHEERQRLFSAALPATLSRHIALRARKYDQYARAFLQQHPRGLVVNLGCGFDTRYWRVSASPWRYIEVDLPDVIAWKRRFLGEEVPYEQIAGSVLEEGWLKQIAQTQQEEVLFLAEGLLMYLPQQEVENLFRSIAATFRQSRMVFETVKKAYTQGLGKKMVESKMRRSLGSAAGADYQFGVRDGREVETSAAGIRLVEEWSYFEDRDIYPSWFYALRGWKFLTRTQWTICVDIGW